MIRTFRYKGLAELWSDGRTSRIDSRLHARILRRLDRLDVAASLQEMNVPGFDFHALRGFNPTRYTVHVNGPWCITFEFADCDVLAMDSNNNPENEMTDHPAIRNADRCPTHPGEFLREDVIPATGKSKSLIATLLGISRQHLHDILAGRKPVSPTVAVRLGKLFGDGPGPWIRMQAAYDTWQAERTTDVSAIPTIRAA